MREEAATWRRADWNAIGFVAVALVGTALVVPAAASARTHLAASFRLRASHGYGITVIAHRAGLPLATKRGRHRVGKVTVRAGTGSKSMSSAEAASASYTVPARFNRRRIRAQLGPFGEVRLRFDRNPHLLLPPRRAAEKHRIAVCMQASSSVTGEFRGVFRFRGEGGYTSVHTHRVHGRVERASRIRCRGHDHGIELKAESGSTRFAAFQDNDFGVTVLSAATRERSGRVEIAREAARLVATDAGEFTFGSG